ncbi:serine/threonine-protein kinase [Piscinibacter sakaiensis]|uniref:Protein kinase domain-containing protein n=1 Tax=Piscinibacter sakaiensis TaxID=1547922 RepID=A0A0K8P033_PISS1|nr:serine/threonine-protein kinase [Piscinibacter sakaiensis]GAP35988.1 hypothetical protein ISF6_1828 [Piscinibacter sakaiensis]
MPLPAPELWQRLSPRLDELLDLEPARRPQRLAEIAAQEPDLAAELARLLDEEAIARADAVLQQPPPHPPPEDGAGLVGLRIGAWRLEAPIGQGGSGSVWRARRCDGRVEGVAAVKLLHLSWLGHGAAERFRREGAILARLTHPHIARLLDAGVSDGGQPYLVLELVDGEPIDRRCDRLRMDVDARLRCFLDVLGAVAHAHRHLVVHRDIKPANVMLGDDGLVKLLDFGIAKLLEDEGEGSTALTRAAGTVLTPDYAAPEQIAGGPISTATDIYALGVLLYQLLGGTHPTGGATATGPARLRAIAEVEPPRLSRVLRGADAAQAAAIAAARGSTPERLGRRLGGDLDTIVARMLRKRPAERYASVDAVAEDLRRHLAHLPVEARPDTWRYRAGKFVRRHRVPVAAAALVGASLLAGLAGTLSQAARARHQGELARVERDRALRELDQARAANEFIGDVLTEGSRRPNPTSGAQLDRAARLLAQQFDETPALKLRLGLMLGTMYGELRENAKARAVLDEAAELGRRRPEATDPGDRAEVDCLRHALAGDLARLEAVIAALPEHPAPEAGERGSSDATDQRATRAVCLTRRSVLLRQAGRLREAEADARAAIGLLGQPKPGRQLAAIHARRELASAVGNQGDNAGAAADWRTLLSELDRYGRSQSVYAARAWNNLATRLANAGQELESLAAQQRAVEIWTELQGEAQVDPQLWSNMSIGLERLDRHEEAAAAQARALAGLGPDSSFAVRHAVLLNGLNQACRRGPLAECHRLAAPLDDLLRQQPPGPTLNEALRRLVQAEVARADGRRRDEREALRDAVRLTAAATVRTTLLPSAATRLARVEFELGDAAAGLAAARQAEAAAAALARGFPASARVGLAQLERGRIEVASGALEAGRATLGEALRQLVATQGEASSAAREAQAALAALPPPP